MDARQIPRPHPEAGADDVTARSVELASVSFTLVLACRDGLGSGPVVLAAIGLVLSGSERRHGDQRDNYGNMHQLQHDGLVVLEDPAPSALRQRGVCTVTNEPLLPSGQLGGVTEDR
jgi:hypothetical protein